jgi:hypothetical protein
VLNSMGRGQRTSMIALAIATVSGLYAAQAHADNGCGSVCITDLRADGSHLHVAWVASEPFEFFEVYWQQQGTIDNQTRKVGADQFAFDIPDVQPGADYTVQVLGCTAITPWYVDGPCSHVDQRTITT